MREKSRWRTLGILGGMGPQATSDVLARIIALTPARRDQDHIPILVRCFPQIPDRTEALLGQGPSPEPALVEGAESLRRSGAEVLAIACNTAHHWYEPVRTAFGGPVVNIAEAVADELKRRRSGPVIGLLATRGVMASGFHRRVIELAGFTVVAPPEDAQIQVDRAIALTKAGESGEARAYACAAADNLFDTGASTVVLACTELPLALGPRTNDAFLDANQALAGACLRAATRPTCDAALGAYAPKSREGGRVSSRRKG
jgi:aspartate racemase